MDRIDAMRVFTRIVELKSFTAAAQDMGLPASTVTDAVKQLERRMGVRLLQRTTRHVSTTLDGDAYYQRALRILDEIEEAEGAGGAPHGILKVEAHGGIVRRILLPGLPRFLAQYPGIELHLSEGDRFVDPVREGYDCVLRAGAPQIGDMIGRRLAVMQEVTVVSPAYVAQYGMPQRWDALEGHRMVGFRSSATGGVLPLEFQVDGAVKTVSLPMTISVNAADSYRAACRQGFGLIQVPRYALDEDFARGALIPVLAQTPPTPTPVSLLYPQGRLLSSRLRVFIDWVVREFAAQSM